MSVFFIGHGVDKLNWGNRGTSLALVDLLSATQEVGSIFLSKEKTIRIDQPAANFFRRASGKISRLPVLGGVVKPLHQTLSKKGEFVSPDPVRTANAIEEGRKSHPFLESVYRRIEKSSIVVINGEGDMILSTPPRRTFLLLLGLVELSLRLGKEVCFINTIVSPCPDTGVNQETFAKAVSLLNRCKVVSVRDPVSLDMIKDHLTNVQYVPDALFYWRKYFSDPFSPARNGARRYEFERDRALIDLPELTGLAELKSPYLVVSGGSHACKHEEQAVAVYVKLVRAAQSLGRGVILTQCAERDEFLKRVAVQTGVPYIPATIPIMAAASLVANAELFISGRYHPAILASLGGTPCVFLGSNSHKTESLQRVLGYDDIKEYPSLPNDAQIKDIIDRSADTLKRSVELRSNIISTVDGLARDVVGFYQESIFR